MGGIFANSFGTKRGISTEARKVEQSPAPPWPPFSPVEITTSDQP